MAHYNRLIIFICTLCATFSGAAFAAEREVQVTMSAIWLDPTAPSVELFVKGYKDQLRRLIVGTNNRGIPVRVKGAGHPVVILGKVIDPPSTPDGKPVERYVPVGEINWPEGEQTNALFILAQANTAEQPLKIVGRSLDDGLKSFPPDSLRVANFSTTDLLSQIDKETIKIAAGTRITVRYPGAKEPGRPALSHLSVKFLGGGLLYNTGVDAWQGSRTLALIYEENDADKNKTIPVRLIVDVPVVPSEEPAPELAPLASEAKPEPLR